MLKLFNILKIQIVHNAYYQRTNDAAFLLNIQSWQISIFLLIFITLSSFNQLKASVKRTKEHRKLIVLLLSVVFLNAHKLFSLSNFPFGNWKWDFKGAEMLCTTNRTLFAQNCYAFRFCVSHGVQKCLPHSGSQSVPALIESKMLFVCELFVSVDLFHGKNCQSLSNDTNNLH